MKKTLFLFLLILINLSCSSKLKSIERKVYKIEKQINKNNIKQNRYSYFEEPYKIISSTKNGTETIRINYEIDGKENFVNYKGKYQIYLENNIPIFIEEIVNGKAIVVITGVNMPLKEPADHPMYEEISFTTKIYIENWEKFEVKVIGGNEYDYNLPSKEEYENIINKVLTLETEK